MSNTSSKITFEEWLNHNHNRKQTQSEIKGCVLHNGVVTQVFITYDS